MFILLSAIWLVLLCAKHREPIADLVNPIAQISCCTQRCAAHNSA